MPGTDLELYQHDVNGVCLVQYDVKDVCRSFREAYADKFGTGWEQWDGPDDVEFFGRFYGSPDGLEEFRIFAESARRLVCEMGVGDWDTDVLGYHGWLQLLENRAAQYPTPLLRRDEDIFMWDYDPDRDWDSDTVPASCYARRWRCSLPSSSMAHTIGSLRLYLVDSCNRANGGRGSYLSNR